MKKIIAPGPMVYVKNMDHTFLSYKEFGLFFYHSEGKHQEAAVLLVCLQYIFATPEIQKWMQFPEFTFTDPCITGL